MYKLELLHDFIDGKGYIEAKGIKSLFKSLTGFQFSKLVRDTSKYIDEVKSSDAPFFDNESFTRMNLAKREVIKELEFYNSKWWIKHKEADFFSKNSASLDEFLEDLLNNEIFFDCLGFKEVKLNNLYLHNQGVIVVKKGWEIVK